MNRVVLKLNKDYDPKDVSEVLNSVFSEKSSFAEYKVEYYKNICEDFEKRYKLNSGDFLKKFDGGEMGDEAVFFDWYAAKKGLDIWNRKLNILKGVSLSEN